jgi:cytochrome c biogenesis factor
LSSACAPYYERSVIPASLGAWMVVLTFPLIVVVALGWPVYVVRRYRAIRRGATPDEARARFKRQTMVSGAICYVVLAVAVLAPTVSPALSAFVGRGGLAAIVPLIAINVLLGAIFSDARATRLRTP